jgi:hypothetical protein
VHAHRALLRPADAAKEPSIDLRERGVAVADASQQDDELEQISSGPCWSASSRWPVA